MPIRSHLIWGAKTCKAVADASEGESTFAINYTDKRTSSSYSFSSGISYEVPKYDIFDDLFEYWNFDSVNSTHAYDLGTNGNAAEKIDNAGFSAGKVGDAAVFDGSGDYLDISSKHDLFDTAYTLSLWFKTEGQNGDMYEEMSPEPNVWVRMDAGVIEYNHYDGNCDLRIRVAGYDDGQWHHCVARRMNRTHTDLYLDGVRIGENSSVDCTLDSLAPWIGWRRIGEGFSGMIDDFMIWYRPLSSREIQALYEIQS